jgi:hypothetical protein
MTNYKISIITWWDGAYPWYFSYFLHSCKYNHSIDFYVITENKQAIPNMPRNVKIIYKSIEEIKVAAAQKLGFKIAIENGYKLNDFKPAYGFLFPELVKGYDFWGHSDLDVIYGNMREFFDNEMLSTYDFISTRHDFTCGCFCLYRNNKKINTYFMRSKDYKKVFSNPKHFCFDECSFAWDEIKSGKSILELDTEVESFTHLMKAAELSNEIKIHFDFILMEGKTGKIVFDNGKVIYDNRFEAILYHLYWLKRVYNPIKIPSKIPNKYFISPTRIYHSRKRSSPLIE